MQVLKRPLVVVVAIVAALIAGSGSVAPAANADTTSAEAASSIAKAYSRITARTGAFQGNDFDFYAEGTLFRDGRKYPGKRVVLQARTSGDWKRVDVAQTSVYGKVEWYFKPSSLRWRLKFPGDKSTHGDHSGTFVFGAGRIAGDDRGVDPAQLVIRAGA